MEGEQVILATGGYDHTIKLWQAHTGICYRTVQHPDSQVNALSITPDQQLVAAAGFQHIRMYDLLSTNSNPVINYEGISKNVTSVGFQEEGKWMYTGGEDSTARVWDLRTGTLQCQRIFQVGAQVNCLTLHPNQGELIVGDQNGCIHLWDLRTDNNEQLLSQIPEADCSIQSLDVSKEGHQMAMVNNKGNCYVWNLTGEMDNPAQLQPRRVLQAHTKFGLKCCFSPDSMMLVTTSGDQTARIWNLNDFSLRHELRDLNQRWVWDCAFSSDSQYIITGSSDNNARLWTTETGQMKREYTGHQKAITCLAFRDKSL